MHACFPVALLSSCSGCACTCTPMLMPEDACACASYNVLLLFWGSSFKESMQPSDEQHWWMFQSRGKPAHRCIPSRLETRESALDVRVYACVQTHTCTRLCPCPMRPCVYVSLVHAGQRQCPCCGASNQCNEGATTRGSAGLQHWERGRFIHVRWGRAEAA